MDFRARRLNENKQNSNSTIEIPKNLHFLSPKSMNYERKGNLAHLETMLKGLSEIQRTNHAACMTLISKLQGSIYSLECRTGQTGKDTPLLPHVSYATPRLNLLRIMTMTLPQPRTSSFSIIRHFYGPTLLIRTCICHQAKILS